MAEESEKPTISDYGKEYAVWEVDEHDTHSRNRNWYILAVVVAILFLLFSVFTKDFLFAVIIIIAALVIILREGQIPDKITIKIASEGIAIGRRFYGYDEIKNFSIVYKPREGVKQLYFEFNHFFQQRLSIPLNDMDPLPIRENLLKYLPEDYERTDIPFSEQLARLFKL